jgi:hypothetical protein
VHNGEYACIYSIRGKGIQLSHLQAFVCLMDRRIFFRLYISHEMYSNDT